MTTTRRVSACAAIVVVALGGFIGVSPNAGADTPPGCVQQILTSKINGILQTTVQCLLGPGVTTPPVTVTIPTPTPTPTTVVIPIHDDDEWTVQTDGVPVPGNVVAAPTTAAPSSSGGGTTGTNGTAGSNGTNGSAGAGTTKTNVTANTKSAKGSATAQVAGAAPAADPAAAPAADGVAELASGPVEKVASVGTLREGGTSWGLLALIVLAVGTAGVAAYGAIKRHRDANEAMLY